MRYMLLFFTLFSFAKLFGQFNIGAGGAYQVVNAVSTLGREVVRAVEYKKEKQEIEQREAEYSNLVQQGDQLFDQGQYQAALDTYNQASQIRQDQYVRDQVARCRTELARIEREEYQLLVDKADSLYKQLNFSAAITAYTEALAKKEVPYARQKLKDATADQTRWKQVQFSGLLISDRREENLTSKACFNDPYSDFIHPGKYELINNYLVYSNYQTLDGIAVPENIHLVIYSEPNFKGTKLLDITGPAIINNVSKKAQGNSSEIQVREFAEPLQGKFPQSVRNWSPSDMNSWVNGSMEITVN
ncbi:tetratricopeptide repeat protein [uncultured Fluviicola sp.]|uniref:tetratricopeptide repeat protein n=1 Tax=uncultured Fluviicola sp. TaxID=463303 RepID=UPI0025E7A9AC|nr:tetratricopeptide repeat protein [uncultured Fluviicola sp.]